MMGGVSPETCWEIKKHWNNKLHYTVASCWFFLWDLYYDGRIPEHQRHGYSVDQTGVFINFVTNRKHVINLIENLKCNIGFQLPIKTRKAGKGKRSKWYHLVRVMRYTGCSNYDAANILVKGSKTTQVQSLGWTHEALYNENPIDSRAANVTCTHPSALMYFQNLSNSALDRG